MSIVPFPSPGADDTHFYRASRYWESNVCGAIVADIAGSVLFRVLGGMLVCLTGRIWYLPSVFVLNGIAIPRTLLPGNIAATFPCGVEMDRGKALCFYAPFKMIYVAIEEVEWVRWSWFRAGWVIKLKKRRGLLRHFVIHLAWGRQGHDLARSIDAELTLGT